MAKDTNRIPQLPSRILYSKGGTTSSSVARNTRACSSHSSNHTTTHPHHLRSPCQASRGHLSDHHKPVATKPKSHKTTSTTKKMTTKEKRQAAIAAAEENAARLSACSDNEDYPGEAAETSHHQESGHRSFKSVACRVTPDVDDEDKDESEWSETSRRPRLTRGQGNEDDADAEDLQDDGIAGLDNSDSDEDDPANSPTRHGRRKDKSTGIKFITVGNTATVTSNLPAKKLDKRQISTRQASNRSSEGAASPIRTGTVAGSSSPRSTPVTPPRTPHKALMRTGRPRMTDESPSTQGLLKAASSDIRQELVVKDAFPERAVFTEQCKATFLAACGDMQAVVHRQRFLKSDSYRVRVLHILRQKLPQVRQEVRNAALAATAIHYGITSKMNPADIVELVDRLKTKFTYVFGDPDQKKAPYGNLIFQIMINALFFEGKRKSDAISNPAPWNPMPLPVLALMATAIHSVLDDWSTGKNEAAKNKFTHDKYAPVYRDHLANLARFNEKAPAAVAKLRTSLWETAWSSTGRVLPDEANVCIDDDIFAEAEAEALG